MKNGLEIEGWIVGVMLGMLVGLMIFGGVKWIGKVGSGVVGFMGII